MKSNTALAAGNTQESTRPQLRSISHPTGVIGTGAAVPSVRVTNDALSENIDTSDEWIQSRVGIASRNICGPGESTVSLAAQASRQAIEASGIDPQDIDIIIFATVTPDQLLPSAAALLLKELGIDQALAFDIKAACSGFLFGLTTAEALLHSLDLQTALVIGAESLSHIVDWTNRDTCVLFGDGAGAAIVKRRDHSDGPLILASSLSTDGNSQDLICRKGGAFPPATQGNYSSIKYSTESPYVHMQGREVFRFGVQAMADSTEEALRKAGVTLEDVSLFIPHQSNKRMIDAYCKRLGLTSQDKVMINLENIGNTSAASIPMMLDECVRTNRIQKDDLVLLTAVGAGMTYGALLLKW